MTTKKAVPIGVPPAVILCNPKYEHNVGGTLRACSCFDISQLWWTGHRVRIDKGRGERLPREERMRGYAAVEWTHHERPFDQFTTGTAAKEKAKAGGKTDAPPDFLSDAPGSAVIAELGTRNVFRYRGRYYAWSSKDVTQPAGYYALDTMRPTEGQP